MQIPSFFNLVRNFPTQTPPQRVHLQCPHTNLQTLHLRQKPFRLRHEIRRLDRHQITPRTSKVLLHKPFEISNRDRSVRRPRQLGECGFGGGEIEFQREINVELRIEVGGAESLQSSGLEPLEEGEQRGGGFDGSGIGKGDGGGR